MPDPNRGRTRNQLMDAISGLSGAVRSVESIDKHILNSINIKAREYGYSEKFMVEEAISYLAGAQAGIEHAIQCLRDGAKLIAGEE